MTQPLYRLDNPDVPVFSAFDRKDSSLGAAFAFVPACKVSNFLWTSFMCDSIISACPSLFCLSCSMR